MQVSVTGCGQQVIPVHLTLRPDGGVTSTLTALSTRRLPLPLPLHNGVVCIVVLAIALCMQSLPAYTVRI